LERGQAERSEAGGEVSQGAAEQRPYVPGTVSALILCINTPLRRAPGYPLCDSSTPKRDTLPEYAGSGKRWPGTAPYPPPLPREFRLVPALPKTERGPL